MSFKILVVDDDPDFRHLLTVYLRKAGYETESAEDGLAALDRVNLSRPQMIISDIRMPKCNGFEFADRISSTEAANIPILFLSAYTGGDEFSLVKKPNFAGFLPKPIEIKKLLEIVHTIQSNQKSF